MAPALPALIGHVIGGAATALVFAAPERRHAAWLLLGLCLAGRAMGTPAPALWLLVLLPAVLQAATHP
jgi:hypothetical protein